MMNINYALMGFNSSLKCPNNSNNSCVFINKSGEIFQISIPFHAIFSNKVDPKNKDAYLLKQIKRWFHSSGGKNEKDLLDLCNQITADEIRLQSLEESIKSKHVTPILLQNIIDIYKSKLSSDAEINSNKCLLACSNLQNLINLYKGTFLMDAPPEYSTVVPSSPTDGEKELAELFKLSLSDLKRLFILIAYSLENTKGIKFKNDEDKFRVYISSFQYAYSQPPPFSISLKTSDESMVIIGEILAQSVLYGSCTLKDWMSKISDSELEPKSALFSILHYWLKKPLGSNMRSEMYLFMTMVESLTTLVAVKESYYWWPEVRDIILKCKNLSNALTATIISRAVSVNLEEKASDEFGEWENVSSDTCLWSELITQIEAAAMLHSALSFKCKKNSSSIPLLEYSKPDISLALILSKGPGLVGASVAKWIASWGLPSHMLIQEKGEERINEFKSGLGDVIEGVAIVEKSFEAEPTTLGEDNVIKQLALLREYFPYSLSTDYLIANISWEYLSAWSIDPDRMELLTTFLSYLKDIVELNLKLGLCHLAWIVHLKAFFENTLTLLHNIGKLPKEQLCRKHLNISNPKVKQLLQCLNEFLSFFIELYTHSSSSEEKKSIPREDLWRVNETPPSLIEVAISHRNPNLNILNVQNQCVLVLRFLAVFPIRFHRPITNLFDSYEESLLWMDIKAEPEVPKNSPDSKLEDKRMSFLIKVINAAIETYPPNEDPNSLEEMVHWISHCFVLANDWSLPNDQLRIQQAINLYIKGCDSYANEMVGMVSNKEELGVQLLQIVGERMKTIINHNKFDYKERMATLTPSITNWIQAQKDLETVGSVKEAAQLANVVVSLLPDNNYERKFAVDLAECLQCISQ